MTTVGWYNLAKSVVFCCVEVVVKSLVLVLLLVVLMGCTFVNEQPEFEVVVAKEGDEVETVTSTGSGQAVNANTVLFDITSQSGIGSAAVKLTNGQWPETILFRVYLNGLEEFKFTYGDTVVTTSVSSTGDHLVLQAVTQAGETQAVAEGSEFYMPVRVEDDCFEIEAPADFYAGAYDGFVISWIDFYR